MPMGILFWVLMILWLLFGAYSDRDNLGTGKWHGFGGNLLLFILLGLLGWKEFGAPLQ